MRNLNYSGAISPGKDFAASYILNKIIFFIFSLYSLPGQPEAVARQRPQKFI